MLVLNDIVKQYGGIDHFREAGTVRLQRGGRMLVLEHLGFGPTAEHAVRVARCNRFGTAETEMHFELRGTVWLPFYLCNRITDTELFLYRFAEGRVLRVDLGAGARLIETAGILDLNLWAEGFVEAADESLYHPLFAAGGAP